MKVRWGAYRANEREIADFLQYRLNPYGVGVVIEAEHLCLAMRGVQKGGAAMVTSSVLGTFRTTKETRHEFMSHLPCAVTCRRCPLHSASVRVYHRLRLELENRSER